MLKNSLRISIRHLQKNRFYTIIKVFGLVIGLSAFLLLSEYVHFEKSFDQHLSNYGQLYRLTTDQVIEDKVVLRDAMSFYPAGQMLKQELPEVIDYTATFKFEPLIFRKENDVLKEEHQVLAVDQYFLKLFDYKILHGDSSKMAEPNQLVLTRSKALEYFGKEDAINESIYLHSEFEKTFNVALIIEDVPANTHYKFDILLSILSIEKRLESAPWSNYSYYTYLELAEGTDPARHTGLLAELARKYIGEETNLTFNLQPMKKVHLASGFTFEPEPPGNAQAVKILSIIAWMILVAAWINYVNLATANAMNRAKEIGLRKVIGAQRIPLMIEFFSEAFLVNLTAAFVTFGFVQLLSSSFNQLVGNEILTNVWSSRAILLKLVGCTFLGAIFTGSYPAMLLSGFRPLTALNGKYRNSRKGLALRKGLVVFQFSTTLILLACTTIIAMQVRHLRSIDKGMETKQIVGLRLPPQPVGTWKEALDRLSIFTNQLTQHPGILSTAVITNLPGGGSADINTSGGVRIHGLTRYHSGTFYSLGINEEVLPILQIELLYGRNFRAGFTSDKNRVIVNEAFFRKLGQPASEAMIGRRIIFGRDQKNPQYEIVGIIKDVNRTTSKKEVEPTVYFSDWGYGGGHGHGNLMVKIQPDLIEKSLKEMQAKWQQFFPNEVFNYQFLDDRFAKLYEEDVKFGKLTTTFSLLAIIITMLGLLGLTSFMASQRKKEIGVRKVLGASASTIVALFYRDILQLLGYATLAGTPLIWWGMSHWLSQYSNSLKFPWWTILMAIGALLILSFLTTLLQTRKVAAMNPTQTLRTD